MIYKIFYFIAFCNKNQRFNKDSYKELLSYSNNQPLKNNSLNT